MPDPTVQITGSLIKAGESRNGGWSHAQLALLGVEIPLTKGWRARLGSAHRSISKGDAELFVQLKDAHLAGEGLAADIISTVRERRNVAARRRLQAFCYLLVRDHLPAGVVETILEDATQESPIFGSGPMADHAAAAASMLLDGPT